MRTRISSRVLTNGLSIDKKEDRGQSETIAVNGTIALASVEFMCKKIGHLRYRCLKRIDLLCTTPATVLLPR